MGYGLSGAGGWQEAHCRPACHAGRAPLYARLPRETGSRGPFVYRLGRQVFNLKRGVRLP